MEHDVYLLRILCIYILIFTVFTALSYHIYTIQITKHNNYYRKAKSLYTSKKTRIGSRGSVYDYHGNPLIGNLACKDILADLTLISPDKNIRNVIIRKLGIILDIDTQILQRRFASDAREVVIKNKVDMDLAERVSKLKIRGIRLVDNQKRYYPKGQLAANILGITTSKNEGIYGLELVLNDELKPHQLTQVYERDRKGRMVHYNPVKSAKIVDGNDVYLTIDEPIQHIMESELENMVIEFEPRYAYSIMINPKTGAILALAQFPSFDPNDRSDIDIENCTNHFITDIYDPGSTMKCLAVAGAIDYGIVNLNTEFDCEDGYWYYGGYPLRDSGHRYDQLSVTEIIQKSSNIGTAKIALKMGENRLYQTLKRFGFGTKTGIELKNESPGILRNLTDWDKLSITRFPIGQGISVTPLQMIQAYSGLANSGTIMQPYLIDRIINARTGLVQKTEPKVKHLAIRPYAARQIIHAMITVTEEGGTATKAAVEGYTVAGKTGTSQKLIDGSYAGHDKYVASFIGFVPAHDPAFVLIVVADEPSKKSYYGGTVAGPTFSRIASQTLRYLHVPPQHQAEKKNEDNEKLAIR